jgi:hypothetical protein
MSVGNMVCEEENTPRCKQNELEPHREANCFVQWCLQMIGADEEAVKERLHVPWLVLFWLGPVHWLRVIALVCSHSYACPTPHSSDVHCKQENVLLLRALTAALSFYPLNGTIAQRAVLPRRCSKLATGNTTQHSRAGMSSFGTDPRADLKAHETIRWHESTRVNRSHD